MNKRIVVWMPIVLLVLASLACSIASPALSRQNPAVPAAAATLPPAAVVAPASPAPAAETNGRPATGTAPTVVDLAGGQDVLVALYKRVSPGIVTIQVVTDQGAGLGSGIVLDTDGHIVTNYHVVDGASKLEVDFISGFKARATVIGTDLDSDLAVVQVKAPASELHPVPLGDSSKLEVGQTVVAIGNPFGLTGTMTTGIVSAVGRTLSSIRTSNTGGNFSAGDVIQTDAAINPGNSGGPLLNLNGEVIGINRAIRTTNVDPTTGEPSNSGIGFAVAVNIVKKVVPVLIKSGKYDYPYMGITSREVLTLDDQEALGLPQSTGAYVITVEAGGPADKAGLKGGTKDTSVSDLPAGGDLIIAADGSPVRVYGDLIGYLMEFKSPGDQLKLTILRDGQQKEVTLTLGKRP